jgi:hypothetical protein
VLALAPGIWELFIYVLTVKLSKRKQLLAAESAFWIEAFGSQTGPSAPESCSSLLESGLLSLGPEAGVIVLGRKRKSARSQKYLRSEVIACQFSREPVRGARAFG